MKSVTTVGQKFKIVILANGEAPAHYIPLNILGSAEKIVCCDGAISFLEQKNITPHIIIGDCDSISLEQEEKYRLLIQMDNNIAYNDLQKAIRYCIANKWDDVVILGATGCRDDHFLANIGILMHYVHEISLKMVSNTGIFIPINQTTTFESYQGQLISVFSFTPEAEITYSGLKYPVYKQKFKELWEGSLNEATGTQFTIEIEKGAAGLVYLKFKI